MRRAKLLNTVGLYAIMLGAGLASNEMAHAQTAADGQNQPAAENAVADTGDIVVTAEKRSDSASRIGMSIAVLSGDSLDKMRIQDPADLARQVPGFSVTKANSGTPIYNLRGVAFNTPNLSSTSPVGVYVDQVAYAFPYMTSGAIFDVKRVEVLKGPQGTLYGRNTTGGLVNFITNKPTDKPSASLTFDIGNYRTLNTSGYVSGPLTSTLGARLAWQVNNSGEGWQRSVTRGDRLGKVAKEAGRLILEWKPTSDFAATLSVNYWHDGSDTQAPQLAYFTPEAAPFGPGAAAIAPYLLTSGAKNRDADWTPQSYQPSPQTSAARAPYKKNSEFYSTAVNLEYKLSDELTFSSLTAYNHLFRNDTQNNDGTGFELLSDTLMGKIKSFSEELRLSGEGNGYNWIVGSYFSHDKINEKQAVYLGDFSQIQLLRFLASTLNDPRYTPTQIREGFRVNDQLATFNNRSISIFANGQYALTDTVKVTGGVRYTKDRSRFAGCAADDSGNTLPIWNTAVALLAGAYPTYNVTRGGCMTFQNNAPLPEGLFRDTLSQHNISWRGNVNWTPMPNLLLYSSVSRGYKSGAFPVIPANKALQFEPAVQEKVTSYEAGSKLMVGPVRFSLAGYYNDYRNKQVFGAIQDPIFSSLERLVNVPKSKTYGAEGNVDWAVMHDLSLHAAASYLRTKVIRYTGFDQFGHQLDFAGTEFPNSPRWQLSGSLFYSVPVSDGLNAEFAVDSSYQSRSHGDFQDKQSYTVFPAFGSPAVSTVNAPIYEIPGYALVNGSVGVARSNSQWKATLWVKNMFDKDYWTSANYGRDGVIRFAGMPRTFGISATFDF